MKIQAVGDVFEDMYLKISAELVKKGKDIFLEITTRPEFDDENPDLEYLLRKKEYAPHSIVVTPSKPFRLADGEMWIKPIYINRDDYDVLRSSCQEYPLGFKLRKEEKKGRGMIEVEVYNKAFRVAYLVIQPKSLSGLLKKK